MSKRKHPWFKAIRGSYIPVSGKGWLTYIPFVGYLVFSFFVVKDHSSSNLLTCFEVLAQWGFAGFVMTWIAKRTA